MADEINNLLLEHLKALRNDLSSFRSETRSDINDVKHRLGLVEEQIIAGYGGILSALRRISIDSRRASMS